MKLQSNVSIVGQIVIDVTYHYTIDSGLDVVVFDPNLKVIPLQRFKSQFNLFVDPRCVEEPSPRLFVYGSTPCSGSRIDFNLIAPKSSNKPFFVNYHLFSIFIKASAPSNGLGILFVDYFESEHLSSKQYPV